jgi:hypothetical protein
VYHRLFKDSKIKKVKGKIFFAISTESEFVEFLKLKRSNKLAELIIIHKRENLDDKLSYKQKLANMGIVGIQSK